jgi:hypothetical protein
MRLISKAANTWWMFGCKLAVGRETGDGGVRASTGAGRRIADGGWMAATSLCRASERRVDSDVFKHDMRLAIQKNSQEVA